MARWKRRPVQAEDEPLCLLEEAHEPMAVCCQVMSGIPGKRRVGGRWGRVTLGEARPGGG